MRQPSAFASENIVVGTSPRMQAVDFVRIIADSTSTVLVTGESGTGKEVVANMIHHASPRRHRPFVAVSCALFSENLIETELFGHERGAFTGAIREGGPLRARAGRDDLPRRHRRRAAVDAGEAPARRSEPRRGAGGWSAHDGHRRAHHHGEQARSPPARRRREVPEDLFYRLNVLPIVLPPLRERREDIPVLTDAFSRRFFRSAATACPSVADRPPALHALRLAGQRPGARKRV